MSEFVALLGVNKWALKTKILCFAKLDLIHCNSIFVLFAIFLFSIRLMRVCTIPPTVYLFYFRFALLLLWNSRPYIFSGSIIILHLLWPIDICLPSFYKFSGTNVGKVEERFSANRRTRGRWEFAIYIHKLTIIDNHRKSNSAKTMAQNIIFK